MGTGVLDKITDGLDIRTKVHKDWLTNNLLFFCTSVEISFECGRTGRASLLFNRKILLFLLFFCLKKIGSILFFCTSVETSFECGRTGRASLLVNRNSLLFLLLFCLKQKTLLYRRNTSRTEGLAGLADIEFDDVCGEGSGTHEGAGEVGKFGKGGGETPGYCHAHVIGLRSLRSALLGELGFAFVVLILGTDFLKAERFKLLEDAGQPFLSKEIGHGYDDGEAYFKFARGAEIGLEECPKFVFICLGHPLGMGTIGIAYRPVVNHRNVALQK